jgi:hypothetical protein
MWKRPFDDHFIYFKQDADWKRSVEMICVEPPKSWRLVKKAMQDSTTVATEEIIFTVRGIVTARELPPVIEKPT